MRGKLLERREVAPLPRPFASEPRVEVTASPRIFAERSARELPSPERAPPHVAPPPIAAPVAAREASAPSEPPPPDVKLFAPEGSAEGCASGACLPAPVESEPQSRDVGAGSAADRWRAAVERVKSVSPRHGSSLANGRLLWLRDGEVAIAFTAAAGFHRSTVTAQSGRALIEKELSTHFGKTTRLKVDENAAVADAAPPSVAEQDAQNRAAHEKSTDAMVRSHPALRSVLRALGGEIEHIQVLENELPAAVESDVPPDEV